MLRGLTGNQIADELGISASSVGTYRKRGYEKLGVADKREFLAFAAEHEAPQADANAAQGTDDGQARKAKNLPHMLRHRVLPCAVLLFLALYHPKNYYPLSVEPYGLSTSLLAPYLAGLVLVVVGLPLCLRHEDKKPKSFAARPYMTQFDRRTTRAYRIALAAAALAAGMLLGQYWLTPIPASLYPPSIVGYVLADASLILAAVLFIGGLSLLTKLEKGENLRAIRIMDLLGNGPRAFIARFSACMILVGCGVLLINADDKLTGYSLLDFYAYVHGLYVGIPRLAVLLLLLLSCGIYVKERDDAARSESDLVAQLIQDGLGTIQAQVVAMTISGVPIATIADKLHITASTVRSYQSRARKLLGISNLSQYAKNDRLMGNCSEKTTDNGTKNHQSKTRGDK